jgi:hypothetical protein
MNGRADRCVLGQLPNERAKLQTEAGHRPLHKKCSFQSRVGDTAVKVPLRRSHCGDLCTNQT